MREGFPLMAMAETQGMRRQAITSAIAAELERQARDGAPRVDVEALAEAVDRALEPEPPVSEGKRPEDLNADNDG